MSEKQSGVTGEDRVLDHLIDVRDAKIPFHKVDQRLDDLNVLGRVLDTVLMCAQWWWEFFEVMLRLPLLFCVLSFQLP